MWWRCRLGKASSIWPFPKLGIWSEAGPGLESTSPDSKAGTFVISFLLKDWHAARCGGRQRKSELVLRRILKQEVKTRRRYNCLSLSLRPKGRVSDRAANPTSVPVKCWIHRWLSQREDARVPCLYRGSWPQFFQKRLALKKVKFSYIRPWKLHLVIPESFPKA